MEKHTLEVGDVYFRHQFDGYLGYAKIDRVTDKYAFSGNIKFDRVVNEGHLNRVPREKWQTVSCLLETEDHIKAWNRQTRIRKLGGMEWDNLTDDQINRIVEITKEQMNGDKE